MFYDCGLLFGFPLLSFSCAGSFFGSDLKVRRTNSGQLATLSSWISSNTEWYRFFIFTLVDIFATEISQSSHIYLCFSLLLLYTGFVSSSFSFRFFSWIKIECKIQYPKPRVRSIKYLLVDVTAVGATVASSLLIVMCVCGVCVSWRARQRPYNIWFKCVPRKLIITSRGRREKNNEQAVACAHSIAWHRKRNIYMFQLIESIDRFVRIFLPRHDVYIQIIRCINTDLTNFFKGWQWPQRQQIATVITTAHSTSISNGNGDGSGRDRSNSSSSSSSLSDQGKEITM